MNGRHANVASFLLEGKDPDRVALLTCDSSHTYRDIVEAVNSAAQCLVQVGGKKGDRVVLLGENSLFWIGGYLGTLQAGLVSVPLPSSITSEELDYVISTTEAQVAFVDAGLVHEHAASLKRLHAITRTNVSDRGLSDGAVRDVAPDDLAALMFTSGSTGRPRGVMVTHRNITANTQSIIEYLGLTEMDRIMAVLPFHYCFGTSILHTHLRVGASLVIGSRFVYPETVLQRMEQTECTAFAGVPSHFQILLRNSSLRKKSLPHLRQIQQAGGRLAPPLIRELREAWPHTQIFIMYGQTEATARLTYLPPEFLDTKLGSIGRAIPGVLVRIVNETGEDVRPGDVGEIVAEGENVAQGYWRAPDESAACFRDGRLYTGDLGTVDEDGFIYVVDRKRDFLKCRGQRVSCRQIEDDLMSFGGLAEAAVIGVPDDILGEAVWAFVVPRIPHDSPEKQLGRELRQQLVLYCQRHMPSALVPKEIVLLPTLPKNSAGKVLKLNLKAIAGNH